jgi:hypothetical protein
VFIQFWLINYGVCPSGWNQSGEENCWINGNVTSAPDFPMTDLANLSLHAAAHPGGEDCVEVYDNTGMGWDACVNDSVLDISSVWKQTEFGVFGDGGGSQAAFGFGTRFTQYLQVNDGSSDKPTCLGPASAGFTGETNNLNQGKCDAEAGVPDGHFPRIKFTESNPFSPPPAPTQCGFILPGQGLTPGHSWHSCNKRFKLAMQTDSNLVLYEGETALWNTSTVGADAAFVVMQAADGNLVIYNTGEGAVWASDTSGFEGAYLSIQNDGNLVIYSGNEAIWASNTGGH